MGTVISVKGTLTLCTSAAVGSSSVSSSSVPVGPLKAPAGTNIGLNEGRSAVGRSRLGRGRSGTFGITCGGSLNEGRAGGPRELSANLLRGQGLQHRYIEQDHMKIHLLFSSLWLR